MADQKFGKTQQNFGTLKHRDQLDQWILKTKDPDLKHGDLHPRD